jgi:excisionase family DNA binding protein
VILGIDGLSVCAVFLRYRNYHYLGGTMTEEQKQPLTAQSLAAQAGCSDAYIRQLLIDGRIAGTKHGDVWSIPAEEARRWLSERRRRKKT